MSPIFRHGRLRLYLLKLLDEAPRHGYEVIRLLQDRFMGVYSPSPGTIYPRLARLEEDGLVTHDEVDGRKVYRITEKGREEIRARLDDLAELEDELTESVRDIAREVSEDVRDTVRSLREEITWAARDVRREGGGQPGRTGRAARTGPGRAAGPGRGHDGHQGTGRDDAERDDAQGAQNDAGRIREEARRARDDIRDTFRSQRRGGRQERAGQDDPRQDDARGDGDGAGQDRASQDRASRDSAAGRGRAGGTGADWGSWADRAAGWQAWGDRKERAERKNPGDRGGRTGWQDWAGMPAGLERLASDFARELSSAAGHAGDIGEGALGDLRDILADALTRIRDEVFAGDAAEPEARGPDAGEPDAHQHEARHHEADGTGEDDPPEAGDRPPTA